MGEVTLFSPAKTNLFLNVLSKRLDGYHDIQTLFERLDLGDTVRLESIPFGIELRVSGEEKIPTESTNLAWRAAKLLQETCAIQRGVRIRIWKRIPVSAGLGGGSSNAATVLLGLNRLWNLGLSQKKLMALGAQLGSDVPFFILQTPLALGSGRGEFLKKINPPSKKIWHCFIKPPFKISTKQAYAGLPGHLLTAKKVNVKILLHSIQIGDREALSNLLTNSLELALTKRVKTIFKIKKELLGEGALGAILSGSGSCVFGLFSSKREALKAARHLKSAHKNWKVFVASMY